MGDLVKIDTTFLEVRVVQFVRERKHQLSVG